MIKLHKTTTALLLSAVILLGGCAEQRPDPMPGADTNTNTSSDVSGGESSESTESTTSDISGKPKSSSENESNSDSSPEESSDTSVDTVPVEFTDEDRELQKILENLEKGTTALNSWFTGGAPSDNGIALTKSLIFQFPEINHPNQDPHYQNYYPIPDGYSEAGFIIPNTCDDIRENILEYFSERCTNSFMDEVKNGSMTENPDGTFTVMLNDEEKEWNPKFLEIDGKMYREDSLGGKGLAGIQAINPASAKIMSKTDDAIEFTYVTAYWYDTDEKGNPKYIDDVSLYEENAHIGVLKYERGGWRRDWDKDD